MPAPIRDEYHHDEGSSLRITACNEYKMVLATMPLPARPMDT